jgi:hypothetical protein
MSSEDWKRTILAKNRIGGGNFYQGRPIIGRDTPIDGGVSLGANQREAIVVDARSKYVRSLYIKSLMGILQDGFLHKEKILKSVYDVVVDNFISSDTTGLVESLGANEDVKMNLEIFIANRVGSCRHRALTAGVLLETFKKNRLINGRVSIDRNEMMIFGFPIGAHAWTRYTSSDGHVIILDAMQKYLGPIDEAKGWAYKRPGDK